MGLRFYKSAIKVERGPRVFLVDIAADRVSVVYRQKSPLLKESFPFRHAIAEKRFDSAPVSARAGNSVRATDEIRHVLPRTVNRCSVQFVVHQHRCHALVSWNA